MKNLSTKDFCRKFSACAPGTRFALKFKNMRDCYAALLNGEAGDRSAEWAIWTFTREGVTNDRDLRLFAVKCARRVEHLMDDERSRKALDVAERYANGEATDAELDAAGAAWFAAWDAASAAWDAAYAARAAARAAVGDAASAAASAAWAAECRAQLEILAAFGNPFEEE